MGELDSKWIFDSPFVVRHVWISTKRFEESLRHIACLSVGFGHALFAAGVEIYSLSCNQCVSRFCEGDIIILEPGQGEFRLSIIGVLKF